KKIEFTVYIEGETVNIPAHLREIVLQGSQVIQKGLSN
ncbi:unnamed protein product, partial [marine sediment metagenome]